MIKKVETYQNLLDETVYEVLYSHRWRKYRNNPPKTVIEFMKNANCVENDEYIDAFIYTPK